MAESVYLPAVESRDSDILASQRHSALVRITHWIATFSFLALMVSGVAILLAHPRLYWGETGGLGTSALINLPLPFVLVGQTGWGRSLHFLAAWFCILSGLLYVFYGLFNGHFRNDLLPSKSEVAWGNIRRVFLARLHVNRPSGEEAYSYNVLQRMVYLMVIFVLFPLIIFTGLAMSPAITSVLPAIVNAFGGQQSARTIHFFLASLLVLFLFVHVAMVSVPGFKSRMRGMITGHVAERRELP